MSDRVGGMKDNILCDVFKCFRVLCACVQVVDEVLVWTNKRLEQVDFKCVVSVV